MAKSNIVVVESPAKAKTIEKFLGPGYHVVASFGHIRDLPKSKLGVDVEHDFAPQYIIPKGSAKTLNLLKKALAGAKTIYLATDHDREGEAIAWHIIQAVPPAKGQAVKRITFAEITEPAIKEAVAHPRDIDQHLVDAQQARRVLDRLVGYTLSPVLWQKVRRGLSAGRVQSVAVKLIVDREREIQAFKPEEYWSLETLLSSQAKDEFKASLNKIKGQKAELKTAAATQEVVAYLQQHTLTVAGTDSKEVKRSPAPPFITSTLQQEASRRLSWSARRTMQIAQQLYEDGLISYMRTDSFNLSPQATAQAKTVITKHYGASSASAQPRLYRKKVRGAQEAHEAIRPTDFTRLPQNLKGQLTPEQAKLYQLVWQRALACQMADARYRQDGITVVSGDYELRGTGRTTLFAGFTAVYTEARDEGSEEADQALPVVKKDDPLQLIKVNPEQHFTSPPPRYTEATLIRKLEENGIGRPSTYAPTISTIIARGYVRSERRQMIPEDIGFTVTDLLAGHFPFVVSEQFTAEMETKLDDIAEGERAWQPVIAEFYRPLQQQIETEVPKIARVKPPEIPTDEVCDKCGKPMVIKTGRFGQFLACTGFPECKNTKPIKKTIGVKCPEDGGEVVEKRTKRGRTFYGCANYPACKYATWTKPKTVS